MHAGFLPEFPEPAYAAGRAPTTGFLVSATYCRVLHALPPHPTHGEMMELSTLSGFLNDVSLDDMLIWAVALIAGVVALVAMVNALDMFLDVEAG
jgi:hypothetical protein